jgi:integrase/recombinase XerD
MRAGSPDRYGRSIRNRKIAGSNPAQSIESSVQIPKINSKEANNGSTTSASCKTTIDIAKRLVPFSNRTNVEMRDIYSRQKKLAYWIKRIDTDLLEPDRSDVLKLVRHMQDRDRSVLWIVRCITALIQMKKHLSWKFRDTTEEDIRSLFKWMDEKNYKASTHEKFRRILKFFYKVSYGDNQYYPQQVKWFSVNVGKERRRKETNIDLAEYLEEEEIKKLIESAPTLQKKAFLACMYETGARPEEFLRLTNLDIKLDSKGVIFILRGKTGERRVRAISFVKLLQQWLEVHPLKYQNCYPLWISQATNYNNQPLGLRGAQKIIEEALPRSGLTNKHARLYILRHSRATHLAKHLTEAQMCVFFGWEHGTKVIRRYMHLSGKDVDDTLMAITLREEERVSTEYKLKPVECKRCSERISPTMNFCSRCALPVHLTTELTREMELEQENKLLKEKYEYGFKAVEEKHQQEIKAIHDQVSHIITMIQHNPQLAKVKPEALIKKPIRK